MPSAKKYFLVSDIHSFYEPFKKALWQAGFRKTNKNHILCILGDIFDRGEDTLKVYEFVNSIPQERRILIRGNHDYLYKDLLDKRCPDKFDFSNGTVRTFCDIANVDLHDFYITRFIDWELYLKQWKQIVSVVKQSEITKWLFSNEWLNYVEIGNYILVHSFIPTKNRTYFNNNGEYDSNWRDLPKEDPEWIEATWGCPWQQYQLGLLKPENENNKTLICGHWHAYDFRIHLDNVTYANKSEIDFSTYISKDIIALDGCTALSGQCNIYVIEEDIE